MLQSFKVSRIRDACFTASLFQGFITHNSSPKSRSVTSRSVTWSQRLMHCIIISTPTNQRFLGTPQATCTSALHLPITNRQSLGLLWRPRFESKQIKSWFTFGYPMGEVESNSYLRLSISP